MEFPPEQLPELEQWLKDQFIDYKPGVGFYQLIRIKVPKKGYRGINQYEDTLIVDPELEPTINSFFARKQK